MSEQEVIESSAAEAIDQQEIKQISLAPGAQLSAHRKALGWSVEQVAAHLKLAPRQIHAIEIDDYASLPGMASVRGFVRAYAKLLKLDGGPLVKMISAEKGVVNDGAPLRRELSEPFSETRLPLMSRHGTPSKSFAMAIVVLFLSLALFVQLMGWVPSVVEVSFLRLFNQTNGPVPAPVKGLVTPRATEAFSMASPVLAIAEMPLLEDKKTAVPVSSAVIVSDTKENNTLVLRLREDSWFEVKRADGTTLIARLLKAGATETVELDGPVQLKVGNPSGVDAILRGDALELKPAPGSSVARLNLK